MTSKKELLKYVDDFRVGRITQQKKDVQVFFEKTLNIVRESAKSGMYYAYSEPDSISIPSYLVKPLFRCSFKDCEIDWIERTAIDNFTYIVGVEIKW